MVITLQNPKINASISYNNKESVLSYKKEPLKTEQEVIPW